MCNALKEYYLYIRDIRTWQLSCKFHGYDQYNFKMLQFKTMPATNKKEIKSAKYNYSKDENTKEVHALRAGRNLGLK